MSLSHCLSFTRFLPVLKNFSPVLHGLTTCNCATKFQQNYRPRSTKVKQEVVKNIENVKNEISQTVFDKVNDQIENKTHGRLFAVVYLHGLQFKVTTEDIIVIRTNWPPNPGDKIRLEKVLLVGSSDFTLIGRPILPLDQVSVFGTVIEKTLTNPIARFKFKPRKNCMKLCFIKDELTYLRITDIIINGRVNELRDTDGLQDRIF